MKKPSNIPKQIKENYKGPCELDEMTAKDIDNLLQYVKNNNILTIGFTQKDDYGTSYIEPFQMRFETELEANARYEKELKEHNKQQVKVKLTKDKQIEKLKKEAKKLGYKLVKE